jgi:hypothetical protein
VSSGVSLSSAEDIANIAQLDPFVRRFHTLLGYLSLAQDKPIYQGGGNLLDLHEIIPSIPFYVRIPINKRVAPISISFSYMRQKGVQVVDPAGVDVVAYMSTSEKEPDKAGKTADGKRAPNVIVKN